MATSPLVPGRLPVAVEDHAYQIEPSGFRRETVAVLRQQADQSSEPGEQSLNPQGLWRRSQESWHHGAGQDFLDGRSEEAADPHRFRSSKGLDIWTKGQVSLLHPTMKVWSTTSTNLHLAVTQDPSGQIFYLHVADGNEVYYGVMPYSLINSLALQRGSGWSADNATIALSSPSDTWFRLTVTVGNVFSATSPSGVNGVLVDPGRSYAAALQSIYITGGSGLTPTVTINWYTAAGAPASTPSASATAAGPDTTGVTVYLQATAPADAAFAAVTASYPVGVGGEIHEVRTASIAPFDDVAPLGYATNWAALGIQAGESAQPVQSLAADGFHVWAALGTSGLHRWNVTTSTANAPAAPAGGQISLVGYANGFLLAAGSAGTVATRRNTLWLVNDPLGTPTLSLIKTHANSSFVWTGIGHGRSCVYVWGNSGGNGEVYKVTFDQNTGTLSTAASPATFLPDGETIHALYFYAGGIIMGTGKGLRLGQADGAGNIDYGPLIETEWPVRCLEPQDRWCWFGWTNPDTGSTGLGRVDLGYFTDTLTPAWALDIQTPSTVATQGDVTSAVTFAPYGYTANQRPPVRVFAVSGKGVYIEDPGSRVLSGLLHTGTVRFSTSEPKVTRSVDVRHHSLPTGASVTVEMEKDSSGAWLNLGASSTAGSYGPATPIDALSQPAEAIEFRFGLLRPTPAGVDYSRTPELTRWTAKVLPTPSTIDETFTIPVILRREVVDNNDANYPVDVAAEIIYLKGLERSRDLVTLQLGPEQHTCYLVASEFQGQNFGPGRAYVEGILMTHWQTVRG